MHVRGDRLQPQPVARQRAGDGAVDAARLHTGNNLRERGVHRCGAQGAHKIGLRGRGHTHAAARQVSQGRERLLAKHDLRRIDIQRQQLHPMLFAQALFQKRPECRHAELETGAVRVQTGKVRRRVLGVVGRHGPHQHRAKRHHAQLQQAQHVVARNTGPVKGHDVGLETPTAHARKLTAPERFFPLRVLADPRQPAHHTELVLRRLCCQTHRLQAPSQGQRRPWCPAH